MTRFLLGFFICCLSVGSLLAQVPVNNSCASAEVIPTVALTGVCGPTTTPTFNAVTSVTSGTNVNATPSNPYQFLAGCSSTGNLPVPAADVWYSIVMDANTTLLEVGLTSAAITNPSFAVYSGTGCGSLVGLGCVNGATGAALDTFNVQPNETIYIQVSGANIPDQGGFDLSINPGMECNPCAQSVSMSVLTPPNAPGGRYEPATVVEFCITVDGWDITASDSRGFIGVELANIGSGWDQTTLALAASVASPLPTPCETFSLVGGTTYNHNWYLDVDGYNWTTSIPPTPIGPGFYFESGRPATGSFDLPGSENPDNNFGEQIGQFPGLCTAANLLAKSWTFCFQMETAVCSSGSDGNSLAFDVNTLSDGEAGANGSVNNFCENDVVISFSAGLNCCEPPLVDITNISCIGNTDGSATANFSGPMPYTYQFYESDGFTPLTLTNNSGSTMASSTTISGLGTGIYCIEMTNGDNCTRRSCFFVGVSNANATLTDVVIENENCLQNDGVITVNIAPGTLADYTFAWSGGSPNPAGNSVSGLSAGTYTLSVTETATGCQVIVESFPLGNADAQFITGIASSNADCNLDNGTAVVATTAGAFTYNWSTSPPQATASATGLAPGNYFVTVTDGTCVDVTMVTVGQNAPAFTITVTPTGADCGMNNGAASVALLGTLSPPYEYIWSTGVVQTSNSIDELGAGTYSVTVVETNTGCTESGVFTIGNNSLPASTVSITTTNNVTCPGAFDGSFDFTTSYAGANTPLDTLIVDNVGDTFTNGSLPAGDYCIELRDASNCLLAVECGTISSPSTIVVTLDETDVDCNGDASAEVLATITGGTGPYGITWGTTPASMSNPVTGIMAGTYAFTVTDANTCAVVGGVTIPEPAAIVLTTDSTQTSCFGLNDGTGTVGATGGAGGFTYLWDAAAANQATATATSLGAGVYNVTVTDASMCTATTAVTVTSPSAVTVTAAVTSNYNGEDVTCFGVCDGEATITATGGTGPYMYLWDVAAGSQTTAIATGLCANVNYSVTITDANSCVETTTISLTQPAALTAAAAITSNYNGEDITCNGVCDGEATATPGGGTGPYTFLWDAAAGGQTTALATGLCANVNYTVTITDANLCTETSTISLTQPTAVTASVAVTSSYNGEDITCTGICDGEATVTPGGGTGPYTFLWDAAAGGQTTALATGLCASVNYSVTVTDVNLCTSVATISLTPPTPVTVSVTTSGAISCNGVCDGEATAAGAGGVGPYSYLWDASAGSQSTAVATGLCAGSYVVTVTDDNGCTTTGAVTLTEPTLVIADAGMNQTVSLGGSSTIGGSPTASGGTPMYTYNWAPATDLSGTGVANPTVTPTAEGSVIYSVTVTDMNGCTAVDVVNVTTVCDNINVNNIVIENENCGLNDGAITLNVGPGALGDYSFAWTGGTPTASGNGVTGLTAGSYAVTVTETATGCTVVENIVVGSASAAFIASTSSTASDCGATNGSATVTPIATGGPYTITWDAAAGGQTTPIATGLGAGTYNVTVTDGSTCIDVASVTVVENPAVFTVSVATVDATCPFANGSATPSFVGAFVGPGTFTFSNGQTTTDALPTLTGLSAGTYNVIATDANGCAASTVFVINNSGLPASSVNITASNNVSCQGANDGSIDFTTTYSGTALPLDTIITNGFGSFTNSNLGPDNYCVELYDATGCLVASSCTVITEPSQLVVVLDETAVDCNGAATGEVLATTTGGTATYSINWSSGASTNPVTGLTAGSYTFTLTDGNSCAVNGGVTIPEPPALTSTVAVTSMFNGQDVSCNGVCDGEATVTAAGGTPPYTYLWDVNAASQVTAVATGLCAGTFSVSITDANNCVIVDNVTVTEPAPVVADAGFNQTTTIGIPVGIGGSPTASGGTAGYTYVWAPAMGLSSTSVANPTATLATETTQVYGLTVTDANGCTGVSSVVVTSECNTVEILSQVVENENCGLNDGAITINVGPNALASYTYAWSGGTVNAIGNGITDLTAGTYSVTVTDPTTGCFQIETIAVGSASASFITGIASTDSQCNASDGTATVSIVSIGGPYTITWSDGQTVATATGLAPGTYTVTVTDGSICLDVASVVVGQLPAPFTASVSVTNPTCPFDNGSATVTTMGPVAGALSYSWSNGATGAAPMLMNLGAGTYTVTVTEAGTGCQAVANFNLVNTGLPAATVAITTTNNISCPNADDGSFDFNVTLDPAVALPVDTVITSATGVYQNGSLPAGNYCIQILDANGCIVGADCGTITEPTQIVVVLDETAVACNGESTGEVLATVTGGTGTYNYLWMPGGSTANPVTGLPVGAYMFTITDGNSCAVSGSVNIPEPTPLTATTAITSNYNGEDISCNGVCDGEATVTPAGGSPDLMGNYTYLWDAAAGNQTTAIATGLCANINYNVTVTDANGCEVVNTISLTEPAALTATTTVTSDYNGSDISCNGVCDGAVETLPAGGTAPYVYLWSTGANTPTLSALCAGVYNVTITDVNLCSVTSAITVTEPTAVSVTVAETSVISCNGICDGEVTATPMGGTGTYTYLWDDAGAQTTAIATGLCAGNYNVTVTDANNCTATIGITITEPTAVSVTASVTSNYNGADVSCNGASDGEATAVPSGGTPDPSGNYTYLWNDTGAQTTAIATGLAAGAYNVTITDNNGCVATTSVTVTEPSAITLTNVNTDVDCNGAATGAIDLIVTGGTGAYSYAWSPGTQSTEDISGLTAGTYTVIVTDLNGCTATISTTITEMPPINITGTTDNVDCNGGNDGSINLAVTGGDGSYSYAWTPGTLAGSNPQNLTAGTYTVTVTDGLMCTATETFIITESPSIAITVDAVNNVDCNGGNDGSISVSVTGGTGPGSYTYSWSGGVSAVPNPGGLSAGNYTLTVSDGNMCTATVTVPVSEPLPIVAIPSSTPVVCPGGTDGTASILISGGTPGTSGYTVQWTANANGQVAPTIIGLAADTYGYTVTDENNCTLTGTVVVTEPTPILLTATLNSGTTCPGSIDGSATVAFSGGNGGPYTFLWSNNEVSSTATFLPSGNASVTVTDALGCTEATSINIPSPDPVLPDPSTIVSVNVSCFGANDGSASVSYMGGTPPYDYDWLDAGGTVILTQNNVVNTSINNLMPGVYSLNVVDDSGCPGAPLTFTITEPDTLTIDSVSFTPVVCNGENNGTASVELINGGTPGYTYQWDANAFFQITATATGLTTGTYSVIVTDDNGCTATAAVTIPEPEELTPPTATGIPVTCFGDFNGSIILDTTTVSGGVPPYSFSINGGTTSTVDTFFLGLPSGFYDVIVTDSVGCTAEVEVYVGTPPEIVLTTSLDTLIELGLSAPISVFSSVSSPLSYTWTPSTGLACDTCTMTIASPIVPTTYTVSAIDSAGCTAEAIVFVDVAKVRKIFVPNAFTPNGDGLNDVIMVYGGNGVGQVQEFIIFNRWGEQVFEAQNFMPNDPNFGWDGNFRGQKMNPGVFVYLVRVEFLDGNVIDYKGEVNLIR